MYIDEKIKMLDRKIAQLEDVLAKAYEMREELTACLKRTQEQSRAN